MGPPLLRADPALASNTIQWPGSCTPSISERCPTAKGRAATGEEQTCHTRAIGFLSVVPPRQGIGGRLWQNAASAPVYRPPDA